MVLFRGFVKVTTTESISLEEIEVVVQSGVVPTVSLIEDPAFVITQIRYE